MQEKNIYRRGHFWAVLEPCFAVQAFQARTECHGRNDVFPRQPGTTGSGLAVRPYGLLELSAGHPLAHSYVSNDHVTSRAFAALAEIGGIPSPPWH